ncbi:MAG: peroxiredoxin-like family protein [Hyphomicrobiaceae bacterium]
MTTLVDAFEDVCKMDAPLNERLAAYTETLRELNFPFAEAYDDLVARLQAGEVGAMAPGVGDPMPPFILPAHTGRLVSLEEILRLGPAVISFNRGHWCPYCKIELRTIASHQKEIAAHGGQLVSILPDRQQFVHRLPEDILDNFIILTDVDNGYALSLGLVIWLGEHIASLMEGRGYRLSEYQGNDGWFVPLPATFVVGPDGRVIARQVDPEIRRRMEIEDIIAALKSVQD